MCLVVRFKDEYARAPFAPASWAQRWWRHKSKSFTAPARSGTCRLFRLPLLKLEARKRYFQHRSLTRCVKILPRTNLSIFITVKIISFWCNSFSPVSILLHVSLQTKSQRTLAGIVVFIAAVMCHKWYRKKTKIFFCTCFLSHCQS